MCDSAACAGGEILALRFDHTVPLARYVALNNVVAIKRYTIGRSYRRDQPQANAGPLSANSTRRTTTSWAASTPPWLLMQRFSR